MGEAKRTWRAARSMASWPMWFEDMEATRSSMERLMAGRWRQWRWMGGRKKKCLGQGHINGPVNKKWPGLFLEPLFSRAGSGNPDPWVFCSDRAPTSIRSPANSGTLPHHRPLVRFGTSCCRLLSARRPHRARCTHTHIHTQSARRIAHGELERLSKYWCWHCWHYYRRRISTSRLGWAAGG